MGLVHDVIRLLIANLFTNGDKMLAHKWALDMNIKGINLQVGWRAAV